jgi:hypothetical protein
MINAALSVWVMCGILAYGVTFAHMQGKYPTLAEEDYWTDMRFSVLIGLCGPVSLLVVLCFSGFAQHGFKLR